MQRNTILGAVLVLVGLVVALTMFMRGDAAPPPAPGPVVEQPAAPTESPGAERRDVAADATSHVRETVAAGAGPLADDPDIRAALCGFRGRVVDSRKVPVADCGVRMYRGGFDTVLPTSLDLLGAEPDFEPQFIAGEVRTSSDGTFQMTGIWPRGFYLLLAGIGTDAPTHQIVTRTPSPGEVVDLGDVVLMDAGVITGTVLDDNGDPLPGALVRAADVPGALAGFFPVERFDPEGALLVREPQSPVKVVEMPKWVKRVFDSLPIPSTLSDGDGNFRLVGVVPGSNMLATTKNGFLSDVRPSIVVRAGQEKNVGKLRLKRGEELTGKVVDSTGKPVAAAEVLAGSTLNLGPVDLAQRIGNADAEGRFRADGFSAGKVTVAARRDKQHPWVLAEPQPIFGEVTIVLPATFGADVVVTQSDGAPVEQPRFKLLAGRAGNGAAEMSLLGLVPPVPLKDRLTTVDKGKWRITNLGPGDYTLLADAKGRALAFTTFTIGAADANVALQLPEPDLFPVRVVDEQNQPIRNAAIYAEGNSRRAVDMPVMVGRTDALGKLTITSLSGEKARISAEHPRWGAVHGEAKRGEELVLVMQQPGRLVLTLVEDGKPPAPGRFSVAVVRGRNGGRGAIENMPSLQSPGLDGVLTVAALQPGQYEIAAFKAIDGLRSPGGVFGMVQDAWMMRQNMPNTRCEVSPGQTAEVTLQVGEKPIEGPTATVTGTVMMDGRPAVDFVVSAQGPKGRFSAKVDERGRFDLGTIAAGDVTFNVMARPEGGLFVGRGSDVWSQSMKLAEGEAKDLTIDIVVSSISGVCYLPDGSPAANVNVSANGHLRVVGGGNFWRNTMTDATGAFTFAQIPPAHWTVQARLSGKDPARARIDDLEVTGSAPITGLQLRLAKVAVVSGRVDLQVLGGKKPRWVWVSMERVGEGSMGLGVDQSDGTFRSEELTPGRYKPTLYAALDGNERVQYTCGEIVVDAANTENLLIVPLEKQK
ncbi:MAG: carboxypeptidase regulatory-like domain-containing protein [Planctomycetes bacterium]|nr:carboxypeptidase regulatory-like domain-containing protein [Planctomycetota bacterium]